MTHTEVWRWSDRDWSEYWYSMDGWDKYWSYEKMPEWLKHKYWTNDS